MPSPNPAVALAQTLETAGLGVMGTNLWVGPVRPASDVVPVQAIFVLATQGREADRVFGEGDGVGYELRYPTVQVRIRSPAYIAGYQLARDCYDALQSSSPGGFMDVRAMNSEPMFLEQDQNNNYHWSINFECMYEFSKFVVEVSSTSSVTGDLTVTP
jgi:hypothetical protein